METQEPIENESRPGKRRWLRWLVTAVVLILAVGGAFVVLQRGVDQAEASAANADAATDGAEDGQEGEEAEDEPAPVPVEVHTVSAGEVSAYLSATANLVAENEVKILAEAEGRLATLHVEEGDWVRKGQVLATLVDDDERIALRKAELSHHDAELAWQRAKDLYAKELISREELDELTVDYEIAAQELAEAEWALAKTSIESPFGGRLSGRWVQVGQHVRPGDELFQVTDSDPLVARVYLPEKDVIGLTRSRPVRIALNAEPDVRFAGHIRQISPIVDTETGTVKLTIEAVDPPSEVRSGSFVTVDIVRDTRSEAVLLPREAVIRELEKAHVFVASEDGRALRRPVTLGLEEQEWVEATSGVEVGERVVVAGQGGLEEGAPIEVLDDPAGDGAPVES